MQKDKQHTNNEEKVLKIFNAYSEEQKNLGTFIKGKSLKKFTEVFNKGNKLKNSNALVVFTYFCNPKIAGYISQDEFRIGLQKSGNAISMAQLKKHKDELEKVWYDKLIWKDIYSFYYRLLFDSENNGLESKKAIWIWKTCFTTNALGKKWVAWFSEKCSLKWVSDFKFKMVFELVTKTKADQSNFDQEGLWPDYIWEFYESPGNTIINNEDDCCLQKRSQPEEFGINANFSLIKTQSLEDLFIDLKVSKKPK